LDWQGDLYGKDVSVSLEVFIRPEQKFVSLDALKQQIHADCDRTRQFFSQDFQSPCEL
jgi:riboflavin kinase/FMN adenylyltransferase